MLSFWEKAMRKKPLNIKNKKKKKEREQNKTQPTNKNQTNKPKQKKNQRGENIKNTWRTLYYILHKQMRHNTWLAPKTASLWSGEGSSVDIRMTFVGMGAVTSLPSHFTPARCIPEAAA